jgi:hypothetical protein
MKICRLCHISKPENEFITRKSGLLRNECLACTRVMRKKQYILRKNSIKLLPKIKKCNKCYQNKPPSEFRKHPSHNDGLSNTCKICMSKYYQSSVIKNYLSRKKQLGKQKEILDRYRNKYRDIINKKARDKRKINKIETHLNQTLHRLSLRQKAINILGGQCIVCNERNVIKLCIDHIHNDGSQERTKFGFRKIVSMLLSNTAKPNVYQVLCFNCNRKKQILKLRNLNKNSEPNNLNTKICTKCSKELPVGMFAKTQHKFIGLVSYCKSCAITYNLRRKLAVIKLFGSKCNYCNETDTDVLEIDHINNDGAIKRKFHNDKNLYLKLVSGERNTDGLQLLCANCNAEKAYKYITSLNT